MGRRGKERVPIAGPAGTYRTSNKAKAASYEVFRTGGAEVTIRYPSHFGAEQIDAARVLTYPTAELASNIRKRFLRDERDSIGKQVLGGHFISGGMWNGLQVRSLRGKVYAAFFGRSAVYRRNGSWEYPPQFTGKGGRWNKRDPEGRFLPAEEGERTFVPDYDAPIRKALDKPVPNKLKAQASSNSDNKSILEFSVREKDDFAEQVRGEVLAYFEQAVGANNS